MSPRIRIILAFGILSFFAFIIWNPVITGRVVDGEPQKVVVILKAHSSGSPITGAASFDSVVELKIASELARQEVLNDVNSPSLIEQITGDTAPDITSERILEVVPVMVVDATPEGIEELKVHPLVEAVYPDFDFELLLSESVPLINADDVWQLNLEGSSVDGRDVSVCVIDTGISPHSAFDNRIVDQKCFCYPNCCPNGQDVDDVATDTHPISHGTHVSGIVAANGLYKGVAPGADIVAVKVCGLSCSLADIISGMDYCLQVKDEYNVVAISGSLGDGGNYATQAQCPTYFDSAIDAAFDAGIASVFASGNNGYLSGISYPGCSPNAIGVGAVDKSDVIASFTNRGSLLDVLAPGVSIVSTQAGENYGVLSGTSQATPHVSGIVALLQQVARARNIQLTPSQIRQLLQDTGVQVDSWKRVDALAAVQSVMPQNTPPVAVISFPLNNSVLESLVSFEGNASDAEDGVLSGESLFWFSSIDGSLGTGNLLQVNLSFGEHIITLTAFDSENLSNSAGINVSVQGFNNSAPVIAIVSPADNSTVISPVVLQGNAVDAEDGVLSDESLSWFSDIDGSLGTGSLLQSNLTIGWHNLTLTAFDSNNLSGSESVFVAVENASSQNNPPVVTIMSPVGDAVVQNPVNFSGTAVDAEDGILAGLWKEEDIVFGFGNSLVGLLSPGLHTVVFSAVDSWNVSSSVNVSFSVWTCHYSLGINNSVDIGDFVVLLEQFAGENLSCSGSLSGCVVELDKNENGLVDIGDFISLLTAFAQGSILDVDGLSCQV